MWLFFIFLIEDSFFAHFYAFFSDKLSSCDYINQRQGDDVHHNVFTNQNLKIHKSQFFQ